MEKTYPQGVYDLLYPINILNMPQFGGFWGEGEQYIK